MLILTFYALCNFFLTITINGYQLFCLGLDNLIGIIDLLKRYGFTVERWPELGQKLGLLQTTLDAIGKNYSGDSVRCLTECLSQWLSRADNVDSKGGATYESLSDALRSINKIAVANMLDKESK